MNMNLIAFYDQVTKALDTGVTVDVVFLDFSKAFDTEGKTAARPGQVTGVG